MLLATLAPFVFCFLTQAPTLEDRVQAMLPTSEENRWLAIPWMLDLEAARDRAKSEAKPMFLWIMNGHPFGCT